MKEKLLYFLSFLIGAMIRLRKSPPQDADKILVVKLDEIGDMVTALHVFRYLHDRYPEAVIDLLCKPLNRILFHYMNFVNCLDRNDVIPADYQLIVELRGNSDSLKMGFSTLNTYRVDRGTIRLRNKLKGGQRNELITNYQIIEPLIEKPFNAFSNKIEISERERDSIRQILREREIEKYVVIHLGARDPARRWPIKRFVHTIDHLNAEYGLKSILVGAEADKHLNEQCIELSNSQPVNLAGSINLLELYALCRNAELFIGNESGPMHIAASANCKLIGLFGPGVRNVFYPMDDNAIVLHHFKKRRHSHQTEGNSTILQISTEEVRAAIQQLMTNNED